MEFIASLASNIPTLALLAYIWHTTKARVDQHDAEIKALTSSTAALVATVNLLVEGKVELK